MKRALVRTAFSPIIYEVLDFAVAIYDRKIRMLAQAPSLPGFMGTMSFCVEAAVANAGGEGALEPGDILLYNIPYGSGSHAQDVAVVMPVFLNDDTLIGYTTIKGHWLDIGGKEPYCTDHRRCLPGRHHLPRHQALPARRTRRRSVPYGARQHPPAQDGWRATSTPR